MPEVNVVRKTWTLATEVEDLQSLDIGIVPLPDEPFAREKGGYKLLLYMAVGIPCVASPVGVKKRIVKDGVNGFLALSDDEWVDRLSQLVVSADLRRRMGAEGRKTAAEFYSLEVSAPRLMKVLNRAASCNP
jgi:glycosyltransferase involved in cell wall biosynthesis